MIVSSDWSCNGTSGPRADRSTPSAFAVVGARRAAAVPTVGASALFFTWIANGSFSPLRSAMPSQMPSLSKTVSTTYTPRFSGRPASYSVVGTNCVAFVPCGATASVTAPPDAKPCLADIANAKRCGTADA
jgi:hypothetical protein